MDIEKLFEMADFSKETDLKISLAERLGIDPRFIPRRSDKSNVHGEPPRHRRRTDFSAEQNSQI
ncbi:hypothetical protein SAMN06296386_10411 [Lachnospiraceae bacterium]|nr:hypothetical protein SAMN06296386_10411 [Lachnospiraceae bacterium]